MPSQESAPVIGGFHTPVERDVFRIMLRGRAPILLVLGRAVAGWRARATVKAARDSRSLHVLSLFGSTHRPTTAETAAARNRYILTLCKTALFAHASPSGKTEMLAREAAANCV